MKRATIFLLFIFICLLLFLSKKKADENHNAQLQILNIVSFSSIFGRPDGGIYFQLNQWSETKEFYKVFNHFRKWLVLSKYYNEKVLAKVNNDVNMYTFNFGISAMPLPSTIEDDYEYFRSNVRKVYLRIDFTDIKLQRLTNCRFHFTNLYLSPITKIHLNEGKNEVIMMSRYEHLTGEIIQKFLNTIERDKSKLKKNYILKNQNTDSIDVKIIFGDVDDPHSFFGKPFNLEII